MSGLDITVQKGRQNSRMTTERNMLGDKGQLTLGGGSFWCHVDAAYLLPGWTLGLGFSLRSVFQVWHCCNPGVVQWL